MRAVRIWAATAVLMALWLVDSQSAEGGQSCGTDISGGVYDTGSYGAEGSHTGCSPGSGGSERSGAGVTLERIVREEPSLCSDTPDARLEVLEYYDRSTGVLVDTVSRCVGAIVPGEPAPPPPPSATEVVRRLPLPAPEVHTSPPGRGLVGFATHLWWGGATTLPPVTVTVGEWTATVAPQLERISWDMGNGDVVPGNGPGTEDAPSAVYTYESQCDCTIAVTLTWGGAVTLSHPLLGAPIRQQAAGVSFTTTTPYEVVEREAVVIA